ncbi:uncharacterized protein LOC107365437 [Tetranychus urticae]|uniref:Uncharacterized protein n=1 Tax=Tetranychus urticae TaxID=32264 RepID=T1KN14_TETUR|nr:uncharacterized protein LOC107365437 [Tetranychus urticae]
MSEQENNSDKTTFKVKHLDEYHDIVIDWNDKRYEYKYQQLFDQLESITGVPNRYTKSLSLVRPYPTTLPDSFCCVNQIGIQGRRDISEAHIRDGECFRLTFCLRFEWEKYKRIVMDFKLVAEDSIPEGVCTYDFCQHQYNEAYFKRLKDIVNNDELNEKVTPLVLPLRRYFCHGADFIFRKFNIKQYFGVRCDEQERILATVHHIRFGPRPLYLRSAG